MVRWKAHDFLLVLVERFASSLTVEALCDWSKSLCSKEGGSVTLSANFRGMGRSPPTTVDVRKLESLGYHVALFA